MASGRACSPPRVSTRSTTTSSGSPTTTGRARELAEGLAGCDRVSVDPLAVETNMVVAHLRFDEPIEGVIADLSAEGVLTGPLDAHALRLVTHLDIDDDGLERAIAGGRSALGSRRGAVVR